MISSLASNRISKFSELLILYQINSQFLFGLGFLAIVSSLGQRAFSILRVVQYWPRIARMVFPAVSVWAAAVTVFAVFTSCNKRLGRHNVKVIVWVGCCWIIHWRVIRHGCGKRWVVLVSCLFFIICRKDAGNYKKKWEKCVGRQFCVYIRLCLFLQEFNGLVFWE